MDKIKTKNIKASKYNPRKINDDDLKKLMKSIDNFGFVDPIIINLKNNQIVGGHQRFKVIKQNNIEELNLVKLGDIGWAFPETKLEIKDETQEKALNIALNKIQGEWNNSKLEDILVELNTNDFDIELTGFDEIETPEFEELYSFLDEDEIDNADGVDFRPKHEKGNLRKNTYNLTIPPYKVNLSEEEYYRLKNLYDEHVELNGSEDLFVTFIIKNKLL